MIQPDLNALASTMNETPLVLVGKTTSGSQTRFEINEPRCIVGSGLNAHLVIEGAGLEPHHCEIVRNPAGVFVRQMADGMSVNGLPLAEAWLFPGDVIQLGDVQLQVEQPGLAGMQVSVSESPQNVRVEMQVPAVDIVENNAPPQVEPPVAASPHPVAECDPGVAVENTDPQPVELPETRNQGENASAWELQPDPVHEPVAEPTPVESLEPLAGQPIDDFVIPELPEEAIEEVSEFAVEPVMEQPVLEQPVTDQPVEKASDWSAPHPAATEDDAFNDIDQNLSSGWQDPAADDQAQASWLEELYHSAAGQLDTLEGNLSGESDVAPSADVASPAVESQGWQSVSPVDEMHAGIDNSQPDAGTQQVSEATASILEQIEEKLASEDLFDDSPEPNAQQVEAESAEFEPVMTSEPEAPQSVEASPAPPQESVADVLARMRASGKLEQPLPDEDRYDAVSAMPEPETPQAEIPADIQAAAANNVGGDDSVKDYMNELMGRLRGPGDAGAAAYAAAQPAPVAAPVAAQEQAEPALPEVDLSDLMPENPLSPSEYKPGKVAPEKTSTLDALRQVANQSVQNAIQKSARKKNLNNSLIYLAGTGLAFFLSVVLFMLSSKMFDVSFLLAILFAVLCAASGFMFMSTNIAKEKMAQAREKVAPPRERGKGEAAEESA